MYEHLNAKKKYLSFGFGIKFILIITPNNIKLDNVRHKILSIFENKIVIPVSIRIQFIRLD